MSETRLDRLYELLPVVYRMRDAERGKPLKELLQVISEQVNLVEDDITRLYENWFIETCDDWVVPYLGQLIGYKPVHEAGLPSDAQTVQSQLLNRFLIPRREIANTIRYRRRKGALSLLELLSLDVANWPARSVEFYTLLGWTQPINHLRTERARIIDVRRGAVLDLINSAFDSSAHTVDLRRVNSIHYQGRYNIPSVGLFVWRIKSYSVTGTPAYCRESEGAQFFTFSVLGNDSSLYMQPEPESDPTHIADEFNLPVPIRRRLFHDEKSRLYGPGKSIQIFVGKKPKRGEEVEREPVPAEHIIVADLSGWQYLPRRGTVAVDPVLGRIAFPTRQLPKYGVWVNYHYGLCMDFGGGEYERCLVQAQSPTLYKVGKGAEFDTIRAALQAWTLDDKQNAVIEITDSGVYVEQINISFSANHRNLQLRAANRQRPVIRLLDWQTDRSDSLTIDGHAHSCFTLDGVLVTGRGMQVSGDVNDLTIRHCTLVPGWGLGGDCEPQRSTEPSLELFSPNVCVKIEHSIVGAIVVSPLIPEPDDDPAENDLADEPPESEVMLAKCQGIGREIRLDPIRICVSDSVLDATDPTLEVIGAPGCPVAHACLTIVRCTVIGQVHAHAIELAENAIFDGRVIVARRQKGCMRFCYVTERSRTPRRYRCQPDLVESQSDAHLKSAALEQSLPVPTEPQLEAARRIERLRVHPQYNSALYGTPSYCQLAQCCAIEIKRGADDESEMGVYHNLFQPQRTANLSTRLDEYIPAGMDVGIIFSS